MSDSSLPLTFSEFRTPPLLRGTAIFGVIASLLFTFISFMAWYVEDAALGLWTLPLWLAMGIYWLWQWRVWARRMRLYANHLEIIAAFTLPRAIPYNQIAALTLERSVLHLLTQQGQMRIRGDANTLAQIAAALEERVSTLRQAKERPSLPLVVKAERQPILLVNLFGLLIGALGVGMINVAIADVELENRAFMIVFGVVMLAICGSLLYWLLVTFVWSYRFEKNRIEVRHGFHTENYPTELLRKVEMQQRKVTNRGVSKTLYTLEIQFENGQRLSVQPGAQNYPFAYAEIYEKILLDKLLIQLTSAYQSPTVDPAQMGTHTQAVTRTELNVASPPWKDHGAPDFGYQLYSAPADFTVTILNYGERQPGAETIQIRLSRPVEGEDSFQTTNGNASFSENGRFLLLHDSFLPIVIDPSTMRGWHYEIEERTFLIAPKWEGETLIGKTLGYGKRMSDAETFGPWKWENILREWRPGLGRWARQDITSRGAVSQPASAVSAPQTTNSRHRPSDSSQNSSENTPPGISEYLWRQLNFIELNPTWVMLGDGTVFAAKNDTVLPRQLGEHVVGGEVQLVDEPLPRLAAFVMDSAMGGVSALYVKQDRQWRRVVEPVEWMKPYVNFTGFARRPQREDTQ